MKPSNNMPDKLKIGLVLDTSLDPPDGVQQYVISIGEWLRGQGHDVHYLVGETRARELPNIHSLARNITVRFNGNKTTIPLFASRKAIKKTLRQHRFDVLHVQTPHHPLMAQPLIRAADSRTAIIGTFHIAAYNWLVTVGNWLLGWWLRPSLRRFDQIVSVSPAAQSFARKTFGVQTVVLPNVIDYSRFHAAKTLPRYDDDVLTIFFLGRLVARKGGLRLLEAAARLAKDSAMPKFRLVICGRGAEEAGMRRFIRQHGLQKTVEMVGFVSEADKPRYYASANITIFPSTGGESFGIVLLEAMASGRAAVLAGDNPGYRSVMAPRPDLLFDPRDTKALAQKIKRYATNPKLREEAARWGESYTRDFDTAMVGKKLLGIYRQALRKRRGA